MNSGNSRNFSPVMEVLSIFTAAYIIGLALAGFLPAWSAWLSLTVVLGSAAIFILVPLQGTEAWLPLLVCAIACGIFGGTVRENRLSLNIPSLSPLNGAYGCLTGLCCGEFKPQARGRISCIFEKTLLETASQSIVLPGKVLVLTRTSDLLPFPGHRYTASGTVMISESRKDPIKFQTQSIAAASSSEILAPVIGQVRHIVRNCISDLFPERHQPFMEGLLLGDTTSLSIEDRLLFQNTGVSHLLAVSGQHLLVLALVLTAVLAWVGTPPLSRALLTTLILLFYALLTAGEPSVWRAIIMYAVVSASLLFEADPGPIRPLAAAALILLLWNPAWIRHVGFQLSFLAVLGIVLARVPLEFCFMKLKFPRILSRYLAVSTAATMATMPAAAWHFGTVPLSAFIVNPLVVWSFDFILPGGLLIVIANTMFPKIALLLSAGLSLALDAFMYVVKIGAALPLATIETGALPLTIVVITYAVFLGIISWWYKTASRPQQIKATLKNVSTIEKKAESTKLQQSAKQPQRLTNPLKTDALIETLDLHLSIFPKRPLKQVSQKLESSDVFPIQRLTTESQNLYYRLDDLNREILQSQPDRLIEAQIYCLALLGNELLTHIATKLEPPPTPADIKIHRKIKNRYLAFAMATDAFFDSPLPARKIRSDLAQLIQNAYLLHQEGCFMLDRFIRSRNEASLSGHLEFREKILNWCHAVIDTL